MTTEQYIVAGLVALAIWLHRAKLLGTAAVQEVRTLAPVIARYVEPVPAVAPTASTPVAPTTTAQLLSLVHHQTEADALQQAHEKAAQAIVDAKATSKASGLPWTVLTPAPAPSPAQSPPAAIVPNS